MNCYIEEKDKEIAELKKEIEELRAESNMRIFSYYLLFAYGDAVSNDTVAMEKAIKQMGYQTRICRKHSTTT